MIKWQGKGRFFSNTEYLLHQTAPGTAARKPSDIKCRDDRAERVRVISVKCGVDFIRSSGFPYSSLSKVALTPSGEMSDVTLESSTGTEEWPGKGTRRHLRYGQKNES